MILNAKRILLSILLVAAWLLPAHAYDPNNRAEYLAKIKEAEAYYKEKCEKVAGIKIYKTVPDVEGVLLLNGKQGTDHGFPHFPRRPQHSLLNQRAKEQLKGSASHSFWSRHATSSTH